MCAYDSPVKPHTVASHSFTKTAATYGLVLRDLLLCAFLLLPTNSGWSCTCCMTGLTFPLHSPAHPKDV